MLSPSDWEKVKQSILDHITVTKGDLDAEYKRVVDATKEWDKRNNLPALQAALDSGNKALTAAKSAWEATKATEGKRLTDWEAKLAAKEKALADSVKAHEQAKAQLQGDKEAHAAAKADDAKALAAKYAEVAKREADVNDLQKSLHQRDVAVTAREGKVNSLMSKFSAEWRA